MSDAREYRLEWRAAPGGHRAWRAGRIDHAIDELGGAVESSPEEAVHSARKDMKKLRALLRLVRGELGASVYRRENARFREAAATLAGLRDADVMLVT